MNLTFRGKSNQGAVEETENTVFYFQPPIQKIKEGIKRL